jgi:regulatory protein YycH of two-component signal transduction system YycFG
MQDSTTKTILSAVVVIIALVIMYIGWSMEKRDAGKHDDLLAIPPKKS